MRKYQKAHLCKHAKHTGMVLNTVDDGCPNKIVMKSGELYAEKKACIDCTAFEAKPQKGREDV
jgi:hypothetical protein